jgi:hypothetical protein
MLVASSLAGRAGFKLHTPCGHQAAGIKLWVQAGRVLDLPLIGFRILRITNFIVIGSESHIYSFFPTHAQ